MLWQDGASVPEFYLLLAILFSICFLDVTTLIVYDRQTLLDLRPLKHQPAHPYWKLGNDTPFPTDTTTCVHRLPFFLPAKKRPRRQGKRSGIRTRIKAYLKLHGITNYHAISDIFQRLFSSHDQHTIRLFRHRWIRQVGQLAHSELPADHLPTRSWMRARGGGVNHSNLRLLRRAPNNNEMTTIQMAVLNTRSLANKSFVLNDFFLSSERDFLFLTETWIRPGESVSLSEFLPPECAFVSTPRTSGRGGGLVTVFKKKFRVRQLPSAIFSSFEVQLLELVGSSPTLCAVVYRPPKFNKDFICEFADFLGNLFVRYDCILITGDFNIHVCCELDPLVKEFLALIDSFNLTQWVSKPTHIKGHTLDLVLSYGLDICITDIYNPGISDHFPVLFNVNMCNMELKREGPVQNIRMINLETIDQFSMALTNSAFYDANCNTATPVNELVNSFIATCTSILDTVAPLKTKRCKPSRQPWLNDCTRTLRRECRQAKRRWKKDKLQISLDILHNCLKKYQKAVKTAKASFLSEIIATNSHKPQVLFSIFNSLISPLSAIQTETSQALCEKFLNYFLDKITALRSSYLPIVDTSSTSEPSSVLEQFEPVSFLTLKEIIGQTKNSNSRHDLLPSRIIKNALNTIGPCITLLMNSSLLSGCFPAVFKHAVIQPVIKKSNLDPNVLSNYRPVSKLPFMAKVLEKIVLKQL